MKIIKPNSLHILFVVSSLRRGGAERVISILANHWAANGREVTVVTLNHRPEDQGYALHPDVLHHRFQRRPRSSSKLKQLLNEFKSGLKRVKRLWRNLQIRLLHVFRYKTQFGSTQQSAVLCIPTYRSRMHKKFKGIKRVISSILSHIPGGAGLQSTGRYVSRSCKSFANAMARKYIVARPRVGFLQDKLVHVVVAGSKYVLGAVKQLVKVLFGALVYPLRFFRRKVADFAQYSWDHQFLSRPAERAMLSIFDLLPSSLRWEITLIEDLRETIDDIQPDVIISFLTGTNIRTIRAAKSLGIPVILSERTAPNRPYPQGRQYHELRKKWYPDADCLVVQTSEAAEYYDEIMTGKQQVIPNPVLPPDQQCIETRDEQKRIVAIGRLVHEKGYDRLLAAYQKIFHLHPSWVLEIWGDGPLGKALEVLIEDYGMQECVKLMGVTNEVGRVLAHSDVFVMTSRYEGFPNALCEAMASGLPPVVFDCPVGPRAIIKNGVNGMLVENNNIDAFAKTLSELMLDAERRRMLGKNAVEVLNDYSLDHVIGLWDATIYEQCKRYASA